MTKVLKTHRKESVNAKAKAPWWKKTMRACSRWAGRTFAPHNTFNMGLFTYRLVGLIAVEILIFGVLSEINPGSVTAYGVTLPMAVPNALISVVLGFLGGSAMEAATRAQMDPRPEQQARAKRMRAGALACLAIPVVFLAQALTWPAQVAAHKDYVAGALYKSDKMAAANEMTDPRILVMVQDRLQKWEAAPSRPDIHLLPFFEALTVYTLLSLLPGLLVQAAPETAAEARRRENRERFERAQATRAANEAAAAAEKAERKAKRDARKIARQGGGWLGNVFKAPSWPPVFGKAA